MSLFWDTNVENFKNKVGVCERDWSGNEVVFEAVEKVPRVKIFEFGAWVDECLHIVRAHVDLDKIVWFQFLSQVRHDVAQKPRKDRETSWRIDFHHVLPDLSGKSWNSLAK